MSDVNGSQLVRRTRRDERERELQERGRRASKRHASDRYASDRRPSDQHAPDRCASDRSALAHHALDRCAFGERTIDRGGFSRAFRTARADLDAARSSLDTPQHHVRSVVERAELSQARRLLPTVAQAAEIGIVVPLAVHHHHGQGDAVPRVVDFHAELARAG